MGEEVERLRAEVEALRRFVPRVVREAIAKDPLRPDLRRQVRDLTVLFMDIAGCTGICEWLPADRMQEVLEECFSSFLDGIWELGGLVNETAGDGMMALFLQGTMEEHAGAAARAASLAHARTREFKACRGDECRDLALHIGVSSGPASVGVMEFRGRRAVRATYTATGPVTNVAARLAALAPAGATFVSASTWELVRSRFEGRHVGRLELKNVGTPLDVYEVGFELPQAVAGTQGAKDPLEDIPWAQSHPPIRGNRDR